MGLEDAGKRWREFFARLQWGVRILAVDDEAPILYLLRELLHDYRVDTAGSAEEAWGRISTTPYDLLITDKNMPGKSGVELIQQLRDNSIDTESIMITGYASVESIIEVLDAGAADYIAKPFRNVEQVLSRIESILRHRLVTRLYQHIVADLSESLRDPGAGGGVARALAMDLDVYGEALAARPEILVVQPDDDHIEAIVRPLAEAGLSVEAVSDAETVKQVLEELRPPLILAVSLELDGALELIERTLSRDPLARILVTAEEAHLANALEAVARGASELYVRHMEAPSALVARARRAVELSRRERRYLHLIGVLFGAARERSLPLGDDLFEVLPTAHRRFVESTALDFKLPERAGPLLPASALAFDDLMPKAYRPTSAERRRHPRYLCTLRARFRAMDPKAEWFDGTADNISMGGLLLRAAALVPVDEQLMVRLELPDGHTAAVRAKVVRHVGPDRAGSPGTGMGLRIRSADYDTVRPIVQVLAP